MRNSLCLLLLLMLSSCTVLPYKDLVYQQQLQPHHPECITQSHTQDHPNQQFVNIDIRRFTQKMLPLDYNNTEVFGYGCQAQDPVTRKSLGMVYSAPGPTIRAVSNMKLKVRYTNNIEGQHLFVVNQSLMMDPYKEINREEIKGVPVVIHAHGMMVQSTSDGHPGAFVVNDGVKGPHYHTVQSTENNSFVYEYPLLEREATLFIHDHTVGMTRLNVYAGISGFLIIDPTIKTQLSEVPAKYDIMLNLQDRSFKVNGDLSYPDKWEAEVMGKAIIVNGKVWPVLKLRAHEYRIRLLNNCGSRAFNLAFKDGSKNLKFFIVKTDSSYLDRPVEAKELLIFPGERYEILIEFHTGEVQLVNSAKAPYPDGDPVDPQTTGKVMKFSISPPHSGSTSLNVSKSYFHARQKIVQVDQVRPTIFIEEKSGGNQEKSLIDGHEIDVAYPDFVNGKTYEFQVINLTPDSHPFHIHLTQFEVILRQSIDSNAYRRDMIVLNGPAPWAEMKVLPFESYLTNTTTYPAPNERALKDVVTIHPKEIMFVRFRFTMPNGQDYPFDITEGPGYVWHCHMLEHEDNSMMVAFKMQNPLLSWRSQLLIIKIFGGAVLLLVIMAGTVLWKKRVERLVKMKNQTSVHNLPPSESRTSIEYKKKHSDEGLFKESPDEIDFDGNDALDALN